MDSGVMMPVILVIASFWATSISYAPLFVDLLAILHQRFWWCGMGAIGARLVLLTLEIRLLTAKPMAYFEVDE
jgi:ribose/xylose/arabinose/galactoside ABC-type transport system permease subunit